MNKKLLGVVLGTLAFGAVTTAHAEEAAKPAKAAKAKAKKKGADKEAAPKGDAPMKAGEGEGK